MFSLLCSSFFNPASMSKVQMSQDWQHSRVDEIILHPIKNNFSCTVGNQSKVVKTMSFYLICRIYVQLTHLALPNKLLCFFYFAFQLADLYSFGHELFLSTETYFILETVAYI